MRSFKFRHYDTRLKEMRYSDKHDGEFYVNKFGVLYMYAIPKSESGLKTEYYKSYKVEQYTGIKDKGGRFIYEGDIISTDLSRNYLVVEFRGGAFMYQCHDSGQDYYDIMSPTDEVITQDKHGVIIGNIHENPDLLTGVIDE